MYNGDKFDPQTESAELVDKSGCDLDSFGEIEVEQFVLSRL